MTGSLMGFVPPPGFNVSKHFPGFENSDGGSIVLLTLPPRPTPRSKVDDTEAFKPQGITEEKRGISPFPTARACW